MKRPHIVHFLSVITEEHLHIRCSVTLKDSPPLNEDKTVQNMAIGLVKGIEKELPKPSFPIQAYQLLGSYEFQIKVIGLKDTHQEVYKKTLETDSFGNLNFKVPLNEARREISVLQIYEVGHLSGVELHLGTFIPLTIHHPKKLVISDFDKTLVDTRYSTTTELYTSLTKPVEYFPTVPGSVSLIKSYINRGYHPFILSASPHFYEDAMRDWLYKNQIFTAGIFLKDYRKVFSILEGDLTPKDLKVQGIYKFNHLLDIILMTGLPDKLVLMGDNFEADPIIYLTLTRIIIDKIEPFHMWNLLKGHESFQMSQKQKSQFLSKLYQIATMVKARSAAEKTEIKIYIRKKAGDDRFEAPHFLKDFQDYVELYEGNPEFNDKKVIPEQREPQNQ